MSSVEEDNERMHVSCADVFIHLLLFNVLTIPLKFGILKTKFELCIKKKPLASPSRQTSTYRKWIGIQWETNGYIFAISSSHKDIKNPYPKCCIIKVWRTFHRKDTNSNQNAKGKCNKKAVKPKFHRLSFLKRGDVNK